MKPELPLTVYFDGSCRVCVREMTLYRKKDTRKYLRFVDISKPEFVAENHGRHREEFMMVMHVKDAEGQFYTAIDAFRAIWSVFDSPGYRFLTMFYGLPGIRSLARIGYLAFARTRKYLPRNNSECDDDSCLLR